MAGKLRQTIKEQIKNAKEGDTILLPQGSETGLYAGEGTPEINLVHCIIAIAALDRISVIHNHPGSCSKNCPALIAREALAKIRKP